MNRVELGVAMPSPSIDWQTIAADHPELQIRTTTLLGEGWSSHAFLVNGSLVFRFPKRRDVWLELEREITFLAAAADALPLEVPRYLTVDRTSAAAAHGYAVYSFVPGDALSLAELSVDERRAAADAIAAFLNSLHRDQASASTAARLERVDERAHAVDLRELADRIVSPLLTASEVKRLREWFRWYLGTPASFSFSPRVIHADLSGEHVLTNEGRVTGVIDFSDVSFGDPDSDFSSLFIDVGEDFALDVARRYGHADLERLAEKLRYFAIADQIDTIVNGDGWALPGQREAAWTRLRQCLS
jgi:aminoglycoside 2''-phosphotransferase